MDSTEQERIAERPEESSAFLRGIFDSFPGNAAVLDQKGHIAMVNQAWIDFNRLNGSDRDQGWIGLNYLAVCRNAGMEAEDASVADEGIRAVLSGRERDFEQEYPCHGPEEKHWFQMRASAFTHAGGRWALVVQRDITARKKVEGELRETRRFTDNLIQTANVMIVGLDSEGEVTLFNPAAEKTTGYKLPELRGKGWFERLTPRDRYPEVYQEFLRLMDGGLPRVFRNPILTKSGEERFISWNNNEIGWEGEIVGTVSFGVDITEYKLAEDQLQDYQQRLKALAAQLTIAEESERRRIAADLHDQIGHSLALARMQLNSILEAKSAVERKLLVKDISHILFEALQDTKNLIFQLSSPSMNELGLAAAISEWLEEYMGRRYGLETEFVDKSRDIPLDDDLRAILFRSVRELLTNVIKHAQANKVSVLLEDSAERFKITIMDDGVGFDPQATSRRVQQEGGFGLFSIEERMADLGGTLEIVSEPGQGCKVTVTVPLHFDT